MKPIKTCNAQGRCGYKVITNAVCIGEQVIAVDNLQTCPIDCNYPDFCDYQLPRDSREQGVRAARTEFIKTPDCTCAVTGDACPIHGGVK